MSRALCLALTVGLICLNTSAVRAQGNALVEYYGEGVHRYFAGDLMGADQLFTRVIDSGSQDPRAYYFRGLIRERQGGGGQFDFEQGARLEAAGRLSVPVGLSLTRVQGSARGKIEKARRDARVMYAQQRALMQQSVAPAAASSTPATPSETGATSDPFSEGMRSGETTEDAVQPTAPEVDATTDPFGDDPVTDTPDAGAGSTDASDPFGGDTGGGDATDPFGGDAGGGDAADPFGGDAGGGDAADPFGGDAGGEMTDPFGGDASGDMTDPFGT